MIRSNKGKVDFFAKTNVKGLLVLPHFFFLVKRYFDRFRSVESNFQDVCAIEICLCALQMEYIYINYLSLKIQST